jgi:hypothetical protein
MSSSAAGEDDPDDGHKSSHSGTSDKNTLQLNKMVLNQEEISALDAGGQQLQNIHQHSQGLNIFILSPSKLKDRGLVTKIKNGRPVMPKSKDGSSAVNIPESSSPCQMVPLLETRNISPEAVIQDRLDVTHLEGHREVTGISFEPQSPKGSAVVNEHKRSIQSMKIRGGVKRKRFGEDVGTLQKGSNKVRLSCSRSFTVTFRLSWKFLFFFCPLFKLFLINT